MQFKQTAKQIEAALIAADKMYVAGHKTNNKEMIMASETMIQNCYNAIDSEGKRGMWDFIEGRSLEVLDSHGYINADEMPFHEDWK